MWYSTERHPLGDVLPGPRIRFRGRSLHAFQVCGCAALLVGCVLNAALAARLNLPPGLTASISLAGLLTIPFVALVVKIFTGEERLAFYHHLVAATGGCALLLRLLGQPVLPFLDSFMLAAGAVRAVGYFGCLLAGCCHGRPCRWGVAYGAEHVTAGVPAQFLGVRLFPSQIVEALWTSGAVVAGCVLILRPHATGSVLAFFVMTYCPARFCFEFARWHPGQEYRRGLSEAQWISLALVSAVVAGEFFGALPFRSWHVALLVGLAATSTAVASANWPGRKGRPRLYHPAHLKELAEAIKLSDLAAGNSSAGHEPAATNIYVCCTSLGIQISADTFTENACATYHYALSRRGGVLTKEEARGLAELILRSARLSGAGELIDGGRGVFHLLFRTL
jgi:hypothetical protein